MELEPLTDSELNQEWELWKAEREEKASLEKPEPISKSLVDRSIPWNPSAKRSVGFFKSYSPRVVSRGRKFSLNLKKSIAEITEVKNCEEIWCKETIE